MNDVTEFTGKLSTIKAKGAPNAFGREVWFQGSDDLLRLADITRAPQPSLYNTDGTLISPPPSPVPAPAPTVINPQGLKTLSTPQPCDDGFVYFQGEGNKLVMMERRFPHLYIVVEGIDCWSAPVAPNDGYVYYRNGASKLARVSVAAGDKFGEPTQYTASTAFAPAIHVTNTATYAYVADGTDYGLTRLNLDQASPVAADYGSYTLIDAPVMGNNGKLYVVDNKNDAYEIDAIDSKSATKIAGSVKSTPVTSEIVDDLNVYWRAVGDKLYMAPRSDTSKKTELGTTDAQPDAQGDGHVYFLGEDEYIYRVSTTAT
jgi:hypothetical protein